MQIIAWEDKVQGVDIWKDIISYCSSNYSENNEIGFTRLNNMNYYLKTFPKHTNITFRMCLCSTARWATEPAPPIMVRGGFMKIKDATTSFLLGNTHNDRWIVPATGLELG